MSQAITPTQRARFMRKAHRKHKFFNDGIEECEVCGRDIGLNLHHVDGDVTNNYWWNLMTLCSSCHSKVHHPNAYVYDEELKELRDKAN